MAAYVPRTVDLELDELLPGVAAISITGARAVGKTATATQRARTVHRLDDPDQRAILAADRSRLAVGERPILIDEWQAVPESWDVVRRSVDRDRSPGQFLLTGSAAPQTKPTHSGAGRIVNVRMRPMTLAERGLARPTVSLREMLSGSRPRIGGSSPLRLGEYVDEILGSGFPGLRGSSGRPLRAELDGYIDQVVDRDVAELGGVDVRNPDNLRRWLTAYAAASSTTANQETIRRAAVGAAGVAPARTTIERYGDVLQRLWLSDPIPAWAPTRNQMTRLSRPRKHQLLDPALAARLLGVDADALLSGRPVGPLLPREGPLLGALFESLVTLDVRVAAQAAEARTAHFRTRGGEREIDLIVERADGRIVAIEVKLATTVVDENVRHLRWLQQEIGSDLLDAVVITTGKEAYRRDDGIAVVPAALIGP